MEGGTDEITHAEALLRLEEAQDTLRAIGLGEVDAFVVSDGGTGQRVFTLSTADRPYRRFVENMRDGAATVSPAGVILYANRRLAELLSCSRADVLGARLTSFMTNDAVGAWESVRGFEGGTTLEFDLLDVEGAVIPVLVGVSPLGEGGDLMTCLTFSDLSAQKAQDREIARLGAAQADRLADLQRAQAALTKQATHDALTGLPNRDLLVDRIDRALQQAARAQECTAVFFIDLDGFKDVNDTHGHAVGNSVLRGAARRLLAATRDMDTVARVGGDEFVVLAPAVSGHLQAVELGARLVKELERAPGGTNGGIRASIGISISERGRGDAELLIHEADTAMYSAKSLGGTRSALFDGELAFQLKERSAAQANLQAALTDGRLVPYYQPIVDLTTGAVAGFEALARLVELGGRVLEPSSFITVAEVSGLVHELGAQVLEQACARACLWTGSTRRDDLAVAVNVSSRQLDRGDLVVLVRDALERSGLEPMRLHLELTETAIMDLDPGTLRQLSEVRGLGVQIGLDDFGTGYASLTHLRRLPLDFVKVDRSFIQGLGRDAGDERIVSAVIDLARNLGLRSVGEGVETVEQLERLRAFGCDEAQGYLFARPAPPEDLCLGAYELTGGVLQG
ncbi:EAL domain-containing protein [Acidimicrobiia bacterium EGI L10123]|uniref:putative bifunctional diguanylate cyclase/phosphodiesterase n=1 Tax=Salinilacustrithrix flava TaxID=2957203 RepID=UPI003D7C25AE|nr:EAL domain-containing protein [Acidimicrobiia bacterium EGI L10123]